MSAKKRVLVFASGSKTGGGSGFVELVEFSRTDPAVLDADIVGVVSHYSDGGVRKKADALGIPFISMAHVDFKNGDPDKIAKEYGYIAGKLKADFFMLSGWVKPVVGLPAERTINIHPGPLPETAGLYGHYVHERVIELFREGKLKQSAVTMHFVPDFRDGGYDCGPVFFRLPILIRPDDTSETLAARVNEKERAWQAHMLNQVVQGHIVLHGGRVHFRDNNPKRLFF